MAKLLVLLLIVAAVLWLMAAWRSGRKKEDGGAGRARKPPPQAMIACAHCGVHLPRAEAVAGRDDRLYCGVEHRLAHERPGEGT